MRKKFIWFTALKLGLVLILWYYLNIFLYIFLRQVVIFGEKFQCGKVRRLGIYTIIFYWQIYVTFAMINLVLFHDVNLFMLFHESPWKNTLFSSQVPPLIISTDPINNFPCQMRVFHNKLPNYYEFLLKVHHKMYYLSLLVDIGLY